MKDHSRNVLTEREACEYIGLSVSFLRQSRMDSNRTPGPPFIKVGRAVRYLVRDLDDWLERHCVRREKTRAAA